MKNKNVEIAFKKLLGNGRAWRTPVGFTSELLEVLVSPFSELKERFINLKYTHFPTFFQDLNNIINDEELFGLKDVEKKSLSERAGDVEAQWTIFSGYQNYKQLEQILQRKGLSVKVIEDIPENQRYGKKAIGNGNIDIEGVVYDPVVITDDKNVFFVKATDFLTAEQLDSLIETVVKYRQGHLAIYYLPRFLRKKEIHNILTKSQMQTYRKNQYCDVKTPVNATN